MSFLKNYNFLILFFIIGCGNNNPNLIHNTTIQPTWLNSTPYGVVVSDRNEEIAILKAQRALAFYYSTKIDSKNDRYNEKFTSVSTQSTKKLIQGYIKEKYLKDGIVYIWYVPKGQ